MPVGLSLSGEQPARSINAPNDVILDRNAVRMWSPLLGGVGESYCKLGNRGRTPGIPFTVRAAVRNALSDSRIGQGLTRLVTGITVARRLESKAVGRHPYRPDK